MVDLLRNVVKERQYKVFCPGLNKITKSPCKAEWPLELCIRVAIFSKKERKKIQEAIQQIFIETTLKIAFCPTCKCAISMEDIGTETIKICCPKCKISFCRDCLRTWVSNQSSKICGRVDCLGSKGISNILSSCEQVLIPNTNVYAPQTRACPQCKTLIDHVGGCKHMTCKGCKVSFCFICLGLKQNNVSWVCGSISTPCSVAPRQNLV
ncbi:hypothetical protein FGO68_gene1172 [Halteria grandinella]|uniref:RBR-type E3 ubiquitin transferase n=1 Tax=Halteria grandinella TaxID=5974 RepID=A0A8J8P0T0_HALGN|nr:hypothetical protein FGO68_gene1172 [Halteria grandinella]